MSRHSGGLSSLSNSAGSCITPFGLSGDDSRICRLLVGVECGRKVSELGDDPLSLTQIRAASVAAGKMLLKPCSHLWRERIVEVVGNQFHELLARDFICTLRHFHRLLLRSRRKDRKSVV